MSTEPWLKFYPSDWRADPGLRMCSYAARGLWIDMLSLMHEAEPYGHLIVAGVAPDAEELAGLLGGPPEEVATLLAQLERRRVFSRTADGVIYSRRMVSDHRKSGRAREAGKEGGNPAIRRGTVPKDERVRRFRRSDNPARTRRIYDRDGGRCHWCSQPVALEACHIDHVLAVSDGGTNDDDNLVVACPHCNGERATSDLKVGLAADRVGPDQKGSDVARSDPNGGAAAASEIQAEGDFDTSDLKVGSGSDLKPSRARGQKPESRVQIQEAAADSVNPRATPAAEAVVPMMPRTSDGPSRWMHLSEKTEVDKDGINRPVVGGYYLDVAAELVEEAAGLDPVRWTGDWRPLIEWLKAGADLHRQILPVVRARAQRAGYRPPGSLRYFTSEIMALIEEERVA